MCGAETQIIAIGTVGGKSRTNVHAEAAKRILAVRVQDPDHDAGRRRIRIDAFLSKMVGDLGSVATGALVVLGDQLGFYKAMQSGERMTAAELARRTGTHERNVREWLAAQAAAGYVGYDRDEDSFYLNAEQATVLADEDSPAFMAGAFEAVR
jgi:hypothetical protein